LEVSASVGGASKKDPKRLEVSKVSRALTLGFFVALGFHTPAFARQDGPSVVPLIENITRLDSWSFFEPPLPGSDPDYTLFANRATLGVRVDARRVAFEGAFRYAQILGLPRRAIGPGPLGPGGLFFAAAGSPNVYQLYFRSMWLRVKQVWPGMSVQAGRMSYESGEGTPFAGRLIGGAEWTIFERAFDGLRIDYETRGWRAQGSFVLPTQGAFEESGNPTLGRVQIATANWTTRTIQIFAHNYRDTRNVRARPDNSGRLAGAVDVNVQTYGASFAPSFGRAELRSWLAIQGGRWYDVSHRAISVAAEATYRLNDAHDARVSGGFLYASGDDDGVDLTHRTFFPMVPTTRPDLLSGTYAQMNHRDVHAGVSFRPRRNVTVNGEVHHLSLATPFDRWYSGTGATAHRGTYFGFSTRSSQLATDLGTAFQTSAEAALKPYWTLKVSAAAVKGGAVVRRQFGGQWLRVFALESALRLP
jgi:hypothetical protein